VNLSTVFSIIALLLSLIAIFYSSKQTKIMKKQLEEQCKHRFTDEPYNAYTVKLESISRNIAAVAESINSKNIENNQSK
jgi:hypothetical protein